MPAQTAESNESTSWFDLSVKCEFVQITGQIVAYNLLLYKYHNNPCIL